MLVYDRVLGKRFARWPLLGSFAHATLENPYVGPLETVCQFAHLGKLRACYAENPIRWTLVDAEEHNFVLKDLHAG